MLHNLILNTDSYKYSHFLQYPKDVKQVSCYIEPRWGDDDDIVFFGLQMFLKYYLAHPISTADVDEAEDLVVAHGLPFNKAGFMRILSHHDGFFPVTIEALPEGTTHDRRVTQVQIHNNDVELPWITTFLETALLRSVWYPTNVATRSFAAKKIIKKWMDKSCDNLDSLNFKLHDFGARGTSSLESAAIGGCAHLVNFRGTDTVMALSYAKLYYGENMAGYSIPAMEHSTVTAWGKEHEGNAYKNMIENCGGPGKMLAMVMDSYDVYNALENILGGYLVETVKNNGATIGVRLDSGNPIYEPVKAMNLLAEKWGHTTNQKGYKLLPPFLRIVQGDGVNLDMIDRCCEEIVKKGWSVDNIGTFGMGGELLQKHDRDTHGYAMKCNAVNKCDENGWYPISKNPVGDFKKASKPGRRAVIANGKWCDDVPFENLSDTQKAHDNLLIVKYHNGKLTNNENFGDIRGRTNCHL